MAVLDPFDMLVRLGKITQAHLRAAELVESGVGTSTCAARLVAIGVDKVKLLEALSELTRMPIASPDVLAAAGPMNLPPSYGTTMKELLAVPIGRVDEHILDVAIADPRTSKKLRDAAIAHRPRLALESDILEALARVFPDAEALDPLAEPTLKSVALAPRPVSVNDGAFHDEEPPPEPPAAPEPVEIADDRLDEPVAEPSPRMFTRTSPAEVTKRVRIRRDRNDQSATSRAQRLARQAREFAERVRANVDARTLGIVASVAVIVAVVVLGFVVCATPAANDSDAGAALVDAGPALVDAGELASPLPPATIEKPVKPKPPRKPPRRPQKKRR